MENKNQEQNQFAYTYSASEQAELKRIREKYTALTEREDKMKRLRRLDASVTQTAEIVALVLGVIGALVLGFGMSLCMTELGNLLGMKNVFSMILGIVASIFGGALASLAYPAYNAIERARRRKLAPEIIRLADELMK